MKFKNIHVFISFDYRLNFFLNCVILITIYIYVFRLYMEISFVTYILQLQLSSNN